MISILDAEKLKNRYLGILGPLMRANKGYVEVITNAKKVPFAEGYHSMEYLSVMIS